MGFQSVQGAKGDSCSEFDNDVMSEHSEVLGYTTRREWNEIEHSMEKLNEQ